MRKSMDVEDLAAEESKPKRKKSGDKGKRMERQLVAVLTERFGPGFSRTIGSGNRIPQVSYLPKHAQDTFTGDLVCPEGFRWVFECKGGYDDVDLHSAITSGNAVIDSFLRQSKLEGERCNRNPILCWKKTRKPWLAFVLRHQLPMLEFRNILRYGDWAAVPLDDLLKAPDDYFREVESPPQK